MDYKAAAKKIKALRIQGAKSIALNAVLSLKQCKTEKELKQAIKLLSHARPTEPFLRNSLFYVENRIDKNDFKNTLLRAVEEVVSYVHTAEEKIIKYGDKRISRSKVIFTHCHSSTVTAILKHAHKKHNFIVHNTETRPFFQGRITATELGNAGIKVVHYVDSASRIALKKADIMLIGCDVISADGYVINKIGSEMMAEIASRYSIPVYVCTHAWKFDGKTLFGFEEPIEKRYTEEVWKKPPKNVEISNFVFEKIKPQWITGVISELGILTVDSFIARVIEAYPWIV